MTAAEIILLKASKEWGGWIICLEILSIFKNKKLSKAAQKTFSSCDQHKRHATKTFL
jgi:hypothetical protein